MIKNKNASRLGKLSWKKSPKSKEKLSEMGKAGWTEERREKQRERIQLINARKQRIKLINIKKQKYDSQDLVTQ